MPLGMADCRHKSSHKLLTALNTRLPSDLTPLRRAVASAVVGHERLELPKHLQELLQIIVITEHPGPFVLHNKRARKVRARFTRRVNHVRVHSDDHTLAEFMVSR